MMAIVKEEDGFTLLELLLVIGVGAVLLLSGMGIYGLSTQAHKINQTTSKNIFLWANKLWQQC